MNDVSTAVETKPYDPRLISNSLWDRMKATPTFWVGIALLALVVFFGFSTPNFAQPTNLINIGLNASQIILLAVGVSFVMGMGELDLSIGSSLILSSVVTAKFIVWLAPLISTDGELGNLAFWFLVICGILVAIVMGILFSLFNALLITKLKLHSFIVTLATMGIGLGLALVVTTGSNVPGIPRDLQTKFGTALAFGILPTPLIMTAVICVLLWAVLKYSRFGLHTIAVGSDRSAAERAGIKIDRVIITRFMMLGALVGVAAFFDIARFTTTNVSGHTTDNLAAIAAAVIGGTSLFGGRASVFGSVLGSLIPVVLGTGLVMMRIESFYQLIAVGVVLIAAVYFDHRRRRE